jgi:SAM-dependent methyltransferase
VVPGRPHYDVHNWAGPESQLARFEALRRLVDLRSGGTMLDVGCGLGDLAAFLRANGLRAAYTGVDVVEEMLTRARQLHPSERFVCADLFSKDALADNDILGGETFDVVFSSGAFNLNLGNNLAFLARALPRLLGLARRALVVNLLHARYRHRENLYFYYTPDDVIAMLRPHCGEIELVDDYLENDFTLLARPVARASRP